MKALLLSSLILFGSVSAHALQSTDATVEIPVVGPTAGLTLAPFLLTGYLGVATSLITSGEMKEVVLVAKADAQDFLAGEEATDTLVKAVNLLKTNVPELSEASDEQIAQIIATLE